MVGMLFGWSRILFTYKLCTLSILYPGVSIGYIMKYHRACCLDGRGYYLPISYALLVSQYLYPGIQQDISQRRLFRWSRILIRPILCTILIFFTLGFNRIYHNMLFRWSRMLYRWSRILFKQSITMFTLELLQSPQRSISFFISCAAEYSSFKDLV